MRSGIREVGDVEGWRLSRKSDLRVFHFSWVGLCVSSSVFWHVGHRIEEELLATDVEAIAAM
jgi:hypothetical protein